MENAKFLVSRPQVSASQIARSRLEQILLTKIRIENFRSIVNSQLELGKVNLFIGPNGGGKSNFLEAVGIVSAALGRSIEPIDLDLKGVRLSLPKLFKSTFKNREIPKGFTITAHTSHAVYNSRMIAGDDSKELNFAHESLKVGNRRIVGRSPRGTKIHSPRLESEALEIRQLPEPTRGVVDTYRDLIDVPEKADEELRELASYVIFAPQSAVLRGIASDQRTVEPLGLTGGRLAAALSEILGSFRSESAERKLAVVWKAGWPYQIRVDSPDPEIVPQQVPTLPRVLYFLDRYMKTTRNSLSAFDASEGTLYLLFVAAVLAHPKAPRTFALDNVDGTLNPSLVRYLVEHIVEVINEHVENNRQIFLTSHNPTALDALDLFNDDHRVYVVKRNDEGHTEFSRVSPPKSMSRNDWIKFQKGRNTSALWLEGFIDGALNEL